MADPTQITQYQTGFAPVLAPYAEEMLGMTAGALYNYEKNAEGKMIYRDANGVEVPAGTPGAKPSNLGLQSYEKYPGEQTAAFNPLQKDAFTGAENLGYSQYSTGAATGLEGLAKSAGLTSYAPSSFDYMQVGAPTLSNYAMTGPANVTSEKFGQQAATDYMSPYMQSVVDVQQREAQRQADIAGTQRNAQAVGAGAFGGSRQAIMDAEAARNLATQKGDIQAQGLQSAYAQAQQQYNADQAQRMQAALANQGTGFNVGAQNLQSMLGVQQLGSGQNLQAKLANQAAYQQKQQLGEQSKQFGAGLGLQGLQAGMQGYQNLGTVGQNLYGQNISNINTQAQLGAQQQQQAQNILNQKQQNFIEQKQDPFQKLSYMSNILRGVPLSQGAQTVYQQPPSALSQVAGAGLSLAALGNLFGGKSNAKGGSIKEKKRKPAGLPALVLSKMG
jgi:hypothetical protein